ncbi:ribonuclease H-like domain-containing protein [Tanacetum coccineum]|uniref:Ribonuclease H-like domain-containing protein n=1 Tax=Tanacetum coccineum TaxID=301880 RepID=A0ABQ5J5W6_9ASTR
MVEGDKPPKDMGISFGSGENNIDQYDPMFLHSNDTNGVPIIGFKLEGTENYKVWKAAITIAIHTKNKLGFINCKIPRPVEAGFMQEQWDRCNFVVLNWILGCASQDVFIDKLKEHNQLLKLMQFLMGLDEVYAPIRSIILTTNPISDVKGAFATLSRDESHRGSSSHSAPKTRNSVFVSRPNTRNNNWNNNNNNNQSRRLNITNLLCTHCNMNGHTADRCFELVGYPPNFKKNNNSGFNKDASSSNSVSGSKDQSTSNSFTDEQFKKLMALISDKSGSSSMPVNIAGSLRLTDQIVIHDVLVVPGYEVNLLSVHKLSKDNKYKVIFDENTCVIQDSVQMTQVGTGSESNGLYFLNTGKRIVNNNIEAKQTRDLFPLSEHKYKVLGQLVHLDVWGPYKVQSKEGYKFCKEKGILHQTSCPYTPQQNGIAERKHRHLLNVGCLALFSSRDVKFYETVFPFKNNKECKEYLMVFEIKTSLNFFSYDENESRSSEPYDDRRDKEPEISEGTYHMSSEGTENTRNTKRDEGKHPDDSEPTEAVSDIEERAILVENDKESEGDDNFYHEFNEMFEIPNMVPDSQSEVNLRRSSRKTSMPKKFSDFKVDFKVKYSIDKHVNYSNLSVEKFNSSTSLNKIVEPKTFDEASKDIRWIEAMNLEIEALNMNETWIITELPIGRKPIGINNYQKLVGKLIYLTHTRLDISYAVHVLSQFMHAPLHSHLKLAFRVLRYLKTALGKGISFNKGSDLDLKVYVDSDWAKCKVTRKSVTGTSLHVPLHCDNSSAIQIAANLVFHERTKHFEIELFFLREKVASGMVKTVKIKSADNTADIFTKGLSVIDHNKFCENLGLKDLYRISLRGNIENVNPYPVQKTEGESKLNSKGVIIELIKKFEELEAIKLKPVHTLYLNIIPKFQCPNEGNYDSLVTAYCIFENSDKVKGSKQLLRAMQSLVGLDEVYAPIRRIILTTYPILDVKGAFATLSRDESHMGSSSHYAPKTGKSAFVARPNTRNNNWNNNNNNNPSRRLNMPNLVCTHCDMNGHTADRFFELVGYLPNFKKNKSVVLIRVLF